MSTDTQGDTFASREQIDALEHKLREITGAWRLTKDAIYVKQYHDVYHKLRSLGWDGAIDVEAELPYSLMPQDYLDQLPPAWRNEPAPAEK